MAIPSPIVSQPQIVCDLDAQQENLVQLVRAKAQDFLETGQANDLEARIIWRDLEASVQNVIMDCPREAVAVLGARVNIDVGSSTSIHAVTRGLGSHIGFPTGDPLTGLGEYLRFLSVQADSWFIGVYELAEPGGLADQFQVIPYTNATPYRPLAVYVPDPDGIVCYPDAKVYVSLNYVPRVTPTEIPGNLLEPLLWMGLSKTLQYDEPTHAAAAAGRYQASLGQLSNRDNALPTTQPE